MENLEQLKISNEVTFGVEFEYYNVSRHEVKEALSSINITSSLQGYVESHNTAYNQWKIATDGSISGYDGGELISPVLKFPQDLPLVKKVLDKMNSIGAKVNRSCGTHVHLKWNDMTAQQVQNIIKYYFDNQTQINKFVSRSRRGQVRWCSQLNESLVDNATNVQSDSLESFYNNARINQDRYYVLNTSNLRRGGIKTLEFRQHQGTLDYEKVSNWVIFLVGLVSNAQKSNGGSKVYFKKKYMKKWFAEVREQIEDFGGSATYDKNGEWVFQGTHATKKIHYTTVESFYANLDAYKKVYKRQPKNTLEYKNAVELNDDFSSFMNDLFGGQFSSTVFDNLPQDTVDFLKARETSLA